MEVHYAALLGAIQGLAEFLPISSSGHLVFFQDLFGLREPEILFNIWLHVGTLVAVCMFFFRDLSKIFTTLFSISTWSSGNHRLVERIWRKPEIKLLSLVLIGTIPTILIGLVIRPVAEHVFSSVQIVGTMLLVTGLLLWLTRGLRKEGRDATQLTVRDAVCIGMVQGMAVLPGISRSGATIAVGLFMGVDRETAARYSFLLSIPAILSALAFEWSQISASHAPSGGLILLGASIAGTVGYIALKVLMHVVRRGDLFAFAPYCWLVGTLAIVRSL